MHNKYLQDIYYAFRDHTMMGKRLYIQNLVLAEQVRNIDGCIVECGVWKAGMIAGIAKLLGNGKDYILFDSFEGLPAPKEIDGKAALEWAIKKDSQNYYDNCKASENDAIQTMKIAGVDSYKIYKGWFSDTLPNFECPSGIALLRLDADWYESVMICLDYLFPKVCKDGLIVIDDYHLWDGCCRAVHDYLSRHSSTTRINHNDGLCYLKKVD